MSKTATPSPGPLPAALDLRRLFDRIDLPQMGRQFLDTRRKDVEALVEANRQAYQALEALGQRQQDILKAAARAWQDGTREVIDTPQLGAKAGVSARRSQQAFVQALKDLRELAELALKSNQAVLSVLNQRARDHLKEVGLPLPAAGARGEPVADNAPEAVTPSRRRAAAARRNRRANA